MATIKCVIVPAKVLKDGKHRIRISVAHNGTTRYILTDITIDSEKEFKQGQIVKRNDASVKNMKLRELMSKYQNIIDEIEYIDGLTCSELIEQIKNKKTVKNISLESLYHEYLSLKIAKESSIKIYKYNFTSLQRYIDKNILIKYITYRQILLIKKEMSKKLAQSTILNLLAFLRALLNYAFINQYIKENPFKRIKLPTVEIRDSWLTIEEIKKIKDADLTSKNRRCNLCRDLFMLSYYLGGINACDLIKINFNEQTKTLKYVRQKTENRKKINKYVEFDIPDEAKEIIKRITDNKGFIKLTQSERIAKLSCVFEYFKTIEKLTGIRKIMYYSARKSFSQHAFSLGVSTSTIDYILGHRIDKKSSSLYHYISVTPKLATDAIRKVLDNLK